MKLLILTALTGTLLLLSGCAHHNLNKCEENHYSDNGKCKKALVKRSGVIKEIKEKTMIVVLEDNNVIEIDKLKENKISLDENSVNQQNENNNLKIGDKINIFVK